MTWKIAEDWVRRGLAKLVFKDDQVIVIQTKAEPLKGETEASAMFTIRKSQRNK